MSQNILDIAKANGSDALVGLVDETTKAVPELSVLPARTITGLNYKTLVRVGLHNAATGNASFRDMNEGVDVSKTRYENRLVSTYTLEARWEADRAVADRYEDGAAAYLALEASGIVSGEMQGLGKQFFYGTTTGSAKGFPGLIQAVTSEMTVNATGTTAGTGSSAWLVRYGPQDLQWVFGANGLMQLSDVMTETLLDSNSKKFVGYTQNLLAYPGLAIHSTQSVARIRNLTADTGKGLTDALIADALATFQVGRGPQAIFVNRRSLSQLQKSRSVTIFSGSGGKPSGSVENIGPVPTEAFGIPIYVTDSITSTESVA
jgi:hypothetical protein